MSTVNWSDYQIEVPATGLARVFIPGRRWYHANASAVRDTRIRMAKVQQYLGQQGIDSGTVMRIWGQPRGSEALVIMALDMNGGNASAFYDSPSTPKWFI